MGLLSTSRHKLGFTLIEIIITIGILGLIASIGLFLSFDFYKSYAYRAERSTIVSVLQKARSQAVNNINEKQHGVHFQDSPLTYVIFECASPCTGYPGSSATDQPVTASYNVSITAPAPMPFDVIFKQLSGEANATTISVSDGSQTYNIAINSEGRIDW